MKNIFYMRELKNLTLKLKYIRYMLVLTKIQFLIESYFHKPKKEHYDDVLYLI